MKKTAVLLALTMVLAAGCGGRGLVLSTPKNLAGTRSVVLPGYTPDYPPDYAPDYWAFGSAGPETPAELSGAENPDRSSPAAYVPEALASRSRPGPEKIDLEIREKLFIAQTNEVYLNAEDYLGKVVRLEGLFKVEQYVGEDKRYCFVLRYGPGCCGNDGSAGFEVAWGRPQPYAEPVKTLPRGAPNLLSPAPAWPEVDAWVEAVGVLDTYDEDGYPYIYLDLFSLTEKDERGAEFVSQ